MPRKWDPAKLPEGLRRETGIHWVAPGSVEEQDDYPNRWVKAYHARQDKGGYWYVVTEAGQDESLEVTARDIHYHVDVLDEMRRSAQNTPGVEIYIDDPHREEGTDDRELDRKNQRAQITLTAKRERS